jgi:hypothetical protein
MAEERWNLQGIAWSETFPFIRLFATFKRAIAFWPLTLAFLCVLSCYIVGRVLDEFWKAGDAGVVTVPDAKRGNEIFAYADAGFDKSAFEGWLERCAARWERAQETVEEGRTAEFEQERSQALGLIDGLLERGLEKIDADQERSADEKEQARADLVQAAQTLRLAFAGYGAGGVGPQREQSAAVETLLAGDPDMDRRQRVEEQTHLTTLLARQRELAEAERMSPRGPFISLLDYEMHCFSGAIHGACAGRWGLSGSALADEPAMIGSIVSAGGGFLWLITQRPWYAVIFGVIGLVLFALFGGALCRVAAVQRAREESLSLPAALRFSQGKLAALVAAPLLPVGIFVVAGILMFIGGLFAAIPYVGEVVTGPLYGLGLLGGVVLVFTLLAVVAGFHLMWPTIAVEGSDAFDAVQRAASYVFQRAWHVGFYSFVLLLYGAVSFVVVRLIAMLLLKLCHATTGLGMNIASNSQTDAVAKLDGIWQMPAWQDLPLLPGLGEVNFWGSFGNAPLNGTETFAMYLMSFWVFIVVGLVGAFVISFYFSGSTEMYFLLRRNVDAVDYDEIYYEEPEEEVEPAVAPAPTEAAEPAKPGEPTGSAPPEEPGAEPPGDQPPPAE